MKHHRERERRYYQNNKEKILERKRVYYRNNRQMISKKRKEKRDNEKSIVVENYQENISNLDESSSIVGNNNLSDITQSFKDNYSLENNINNLDFKISYDYCITDVNLIIEFITKKCNCAQCNDDFILLSFKSIGNAMVLQFLCKGCGTIEEFQSSEKQSYGYLINQHLTTSLQLSGIDYSQYNELCANMGLPSITNSVFQKYTNQLWEIVEKNITPKRMEENRRFIYQQSIYSHLSLFKKFNFTDLVLEIIYSFLFGVKIPLTVSVDARWSSRRNGNECTCIFYECNYKVVIGIQNVLRKHSNENEDSRSGNLFVGASKCLEGIGVERILEELKEWKSPEGKLKFKIHAFVHDHDSTTDSIIKKHFNCIEYFDIGHKSKNLKNQISKIPVLKRLSAKVSLIFRTVVKVANGDETVMKLMLKAYPYYLCGNHDYCTVTTCSKDKKPLINLQTKEGEEKFVMLKNIFNKLVETCSYYCHLYNTNINESLNNSIASFVEKQKDFKTTYSGRADYVILKRFEGIKINSEIFSSLDIPNTDNMIREINKIDITKEKDKQQKEKNKEKKKERKKKLKEIHKVKNNKLYSYGDSKEFELETLLQKKHNFNSNGCSCSRNSKCIRKCYCKKLGKHCDSSCGLC